jgi:hypothetical protein
MAAVPGLAAAVSEADTTATECDRGGPRSGLGRAEGLPGLVLVSSYVELSAVIGKSPLLHRYVESAIKAGLALVDGEAGVSTWTACGDYLT